MSVPNRILALSVLVWSVGTSTHSTASPATHLTKALSRWVTEEGTNEAAERVAKEVGDAMAARVAAKLAREGGQESLERVSNLTAKYGPDIVRALDNAPATKPVTPLLRALDELPADQVSKAAARLAGPQGRELADTAIRYGTSALRAELTHPGVGGHIVRAIGSDGAMLCGTLSRDQAIAIARHIDGIAQVPPAQKTQLLALIARDKDRFFAWLGGFVEANPGKSIGSVAFLAVFLPNADRILGGDEIVIGPDGEPRVISKPGIVGRYILEPLREAIALFGRGVAAIVVAVIGIVAAWILWGGKGRMQRKSRGKNHRKTAGTR